MNDIDIVESSSNFELVDRAPFYGSDPHENAVGRVGDQVVAMNIGPDTIVIGRVMGGLELRVGKAVRVGRHGRVGTLDDRVERDGWPGLDHVDRRVNVADRIDVDLPAAKTHVRMVDVVEEDALVLQDHAIERPIQIGPKDQPAPISLFGYGRT